MAKPMSARQAGERMGIPHKEVLRRIHKGQIKATRVDWNWMTTEEWVDDAMKSEWYLRTYAAKT